MNTKINELIARATTVEDTYPAGCNGHPVPVYSFDKQKFAELIVKECMMQVLDYVYINGKKDGVTYFADDAIGEHFGIEE